MFWQRKSKAIETGINSGVRITLLHKYVDNIIIATNVEERRHDASNAEVHLSRLAPIIMTFLFHS